MQKYYFSLAFCELRKVRTPFTINPHFLNKKRFELSNHLGNALATISDYKKPNDVNADALVDFYNAQVISSQDYYPFGAPMKERTFSSAGYRYGFNGKENDNEVKGQGNQVDFDARIYDTRLGRWLSLDPLQKKYPNLNPYNFCANNPLTYVDSDGREIIISGTAEFVTKTFTHLQSLTNKQLVLLGNGTVMEAHNLPPYAKSAVLIKGEPMKIPAPYVKKSYGTDLISDLVNDKNHKVEISTQTNYKGGNKTTPKSFDAYEKGVGSDVDIVFDLTDDEGGIDVNNNFARPFNIGLAHELLHARKAFKGESKGIDKKEGKQSNGKFYPSNLEKDYFDPDNPGVKGNLPTEEITVRKEENIIRKEQSVTPRREPSKKDE
jgi:RHS repeat-associated protein